MKGFKIPFSTRPIQVHKYREPKWFPTESIQLDNAIKKKIKIGAMSTYEQFLIAKLSSYLFLVHKPKGTNRMILNLKSLNEFIHCEHFKLEDCKVVMRLISKNCFLATLDIKDAYFFMPIDKNDKRYLRF